MNSQRSSARRSKGFTLLEMLIVIAIIVILATVSVAMLGIPKVQLSRDAGINPTSATGGIG